MSNQMRWRYGETNPIMEDVDSSSVIEIGDLCYLDTDDVKPADLQTDRGSEVLNQREFAPNFLGVAMQASASGDTDEIRVATAGVFEFDCASATWEVGDLVGVEEDTGGTELENQTVVSVATEELAIGRVAKRETTATTKVRVEIKGRVTRPPKFLDANGLRGPSSYPVGVIPTGAPASKAAGAGGAIGVTSYYTSIATDAGGDAYTLDDGTVDGQLIKIQMIADGGGDGVVTPSNLGGGTTLTFADVGDYAILMWNSTEWDVIELGNQADGATAPVLA